VPVTPLMLLSLCLRSGLQGGFQVVNADFAELKQRLPEHALKPRALNSPPRLPLRPGSR
jgi:hypothetical protein